jgi:hypothetical protein
MFQLVRSYDVRQKKITPGALDGDNKIACIKSKLILVKQFMRTLKRQ